ncbi:hypothetical protein BDZ94DRAFT_1278606, partial [Collybia nuda]
YRNKTITRIFGGNSRYGCYFLAVMIFSFGILQDSNSLIALFIIGQTFVVTSTWALGVTGTFLGDYFSILMDHCVEGYERPAGLLITIYVYIVYVIALCFEGPFTDMIYTKRAEEWANGSKKEI